ncbi:MAG: hypothetical protein QNK37_36650 [Acidobacteriota bacterium]|nr:hypothetical protein [Acidobacteriota bacterium]
MRRFLFKTTLWLVGFFLILKAVGMLDNLDRTNENILRIRQVGTLSNLDVLFVGNSYTHTGIDPLQLRESGLETYSLGINAAGVAFYRLLLDDYTRQTGAIPKTIMLLVSPMSFSRFADTFPSIPIHRYLYHPLSNETVAWRFGAPYDQLLRRSFRKGLANAPLLFTAEEESADMKEMLTYRGFVPSRMTFSGKVHPEIAASYEPLSRDPFPMDSLEDLQDLALEYRNKGARVVFYELPTGEAPGLFHAQFLDDYERALADLKKNGFEVLRIQWDTRPLDFRNMDHLNSRGAARATGAIAEYLSEKPGTAAGGHAEESVR